MERFTYNNRQLLETTNKLLVYCKSHSQPTIATVLSLSGNLGAGKTTLVQTLGSLLGVTEVITSPTFVVMKRYKTTHLVFSELIHIDAYRIEKIVEMEVLGFLDWLKKPATLICIEWPEKISALIPTTAIPVTLEVVDEITREITYG